MNSIKSGAGANGTFAMNTTGTKTIDFVGIDIPTTVTITALTNKSGAAVALADYMLDPSGGVIPGGYITANNQDEYFKSITTSAGDCILNLKGE